MLISVAVPVPNLDLLTYRVPDDLDPPVIGARVVVPLGSRTVTGIVVATGAPVEASGAAAGRDIKRVRRVLDADAFVPPEVVALAQWTAEYYAAGVGDTIPALLPPMARGGRADARKTARVAAITASGLNALVSITGSAPDRARALTAKQRDALEALAAARVGLPTAELARHGVSSETVARLAARGLVGLRRDPVDRDPFLDSTGRQSGTDSELAPADRRLTAEQASAVARLEALTSAAEFRVALLCGVTGSGKTEIYVRLAGAVRAAGRRVLMLVPEIALTPAMAAVFRQTFGEGVAIQHSGLSDGQRHDQWQRIRRGDIDVVVGTRSAVFAPLERVGLIIVDEEHDASYKQDESPRYNGRDVAIVRGRSAGAVVVLGSATPSLESYHNAVSGKYERIVLERRVLDRPLASVTIVDMREVYAAEGPDVILSRALRDGIQLRRDRGEQTLVLLNRRGFATAVFCRQCAGTLDCPNCSVSLVVHGAGAARKARCHYCNYAVSLPPVCPHCAGPYLEQAGFGTQRVEAEVKKACPGARVARLDRDAIRRKGALSTLLSTFRDGRIDVLVGTQMIAKGHDFPRVTLVGVVSADVGLGLADFRASERTFQLLTQVAGRAGRGEQQGEAIVQTLYPGHYSIQLACRQDYPAFFEKEMVFRRAMRYPPLLSIVNLVVRSRTFAGAMGDAADLARRLRTADGGREEILVLGPAPAPLGRLRGEYRSQVLIKGTHRRKIREALRMAIANRPDLQRRLIVDIDPTSVL